VAGYEFSEHAYDMLTERNIREDWVRSTMENPQRTEAKEDGTIHDIRPIGEFGGRYLRVVVDPAVVPKKIVTIFLDRRLGRSS
jgi:hypothetical protein